MYNTPLKLAADFIVRQLWGLYYHIYFIFSTLKYHC